MNSIISNDRQCYVCGTRMNLHKHHIFYGTGNRKLSEKYGCWIYLCAYHHNMSDKGVHFNKKLDNELKSLCQREFEKRYKENFLTVFGRNFIE